jgi:hypothetical protein
MKRKSEKGKIARDRWPSIVERYKGGGTMAELAREYGCTPPAIRYILTRMGALSASRSSQLPRDVGLKGEAHAHEQIDVGGLGSPGRPPFRQQSTYKHSSPERAMEGGVVDVDLRKRLSADVANLLVSIDQAVAYDVGSLSTLEDAIDRLMRSAARVRIELERWLIDNRSTGHEEGTHGTRFRVGVAQ